MLPFYASMLPVIGAECIGCEIVIRKFHFFVKRETMAEIPSHCLVSHCEAVAR